MAKKATTTAKPPKVKAEKEEKRQVIGGKSEKAEPIQYPKQIQDRIDYHNSCIGVEINHYRSLTGQELLRHETSPIASEFLERIQEHNDSIESIINSN